MQGLELWIKGNIEIKTNISDIQELFVAKIIITEFLPVTSHIIQGLFIDFQSGNLTLPDDFLSDKHICKINLLD